MTIEIATSQYERSHASKPRGYGHRIFELSEGPERGEVVDLYGSYSTMKRVAVGIARNRGYALVNVCP